jgi:hypothetical protein
MPNKKVNVTGPTGASIDVEISFGAVLVNHSDPKVGKFHFPAGPFYALDRSSSSRRYDAQYHVIEGAVAAGKGGKKGGPRAVVKLEDLYAIADAILSLVDSA